MEDDCLSLSTRPVKSDQLPIGARGDIACIAMFNVTLATQKSLAK